MSAVSKNPFDALGEEDEDRVAQPVAKDVKDVKKAAAPAAKPAASTAASKDGPKGQASQGDRRPPRREFERHSGTGRGRRSDGAEDKRGGSGKYNWGTKDAGTTPNDEAGDLNESREMTEEEKAAAEAAAEAKRKEEAQMTLDEFLKKKEQEKSEAEKLEARKVEAIDMKGLKVKDAAAEDVWTIGEEDKGGKGSKSKKSGRKATPFMDANFTTPPIETGPSGGGRGRGRGGGGGGGRGDYRPRGPGGGGAQAAAPAVSLDNATFPSLG
jgi:plasminogen activator inhibitor 1 RNA-binding protein